MTRLTIKKESAVQYKVPATVLKEDLSDQSGAELCEAWIALKQAEKVFNADRIRVEVELMKRIGADKQSLFTQRTYHEPGFKVAVSLDASFKMDWNLWGNLRGEIPEPMRPTRWIETVDKAKVKYLRVTEPAVFAQVAAALTTTPNKPSVTVEANVASIAEQRG